MRTSTALLLFCLLIFAGGCTQDKVPNANKETPVQYKMVPAQGDPNAAK